MVEKQIKHGADVDEMSSLYNKNPQDILDYSSNINPNPPGGLSGFVMEAISSLDKYPDLSYRNLRTSIAKYLDTKMEFVIPGNGASEIIYLLMKSIGGRLAVMNPTFGEYERAASLAGRETIDLYYDIENGFAIDLKEVEKNMGSFDSLVICNPNNPTGRVQDIRSLLELLERNGKLLIVDETFMEFWHESDKYSLLSLVKDHKNLIVIKAVTKFFGLPGIRLGYGISSDEKLLAKMWSAKEPWTVNTFAEKVSPKIFTDEEYIKNSKTFYKEEIGFVEEELSKIENLHAFKTNTNFILLKLDNMKACELKTQMFKKDDILIRDASNFKGLDDRFIRIAVKDRKNNKRVIDSLKSLLGD